MISISTDNIAKKILARAALRHVLHADRPQILTQAHRPAIEKIMETAFNFLCAALIPHIESAQADIPGGNLSLILRPELLDIGETSLRNILEEALVAYTLYLCYSSANHPMASDELQTFHTLMTQLRQSAGCSATFPVRPFWL